MASSSLPSLALALALSSFGFMLSEEMEEGEAIEEEEKRMKIMTDIVKSIEKITLV